MREFVAKRSPKRNAKGQELKSNATDNDSAKMATSKGVIQGYSAQATADAGYHSEENLQALQARGIPAMIADNAMRKRDERYSDQAKHKAKRSPLYNKAGPSEKPKLFRPIDFKHDPKTNTCVCPAGEVLYSNGSHCTVGGRPHPNSPVQRRAACPVRYAISAYESPMSRR